MRETTPIAMPPCFNKWCQRFDDLFLNKSQKREFRHYLGVLLGESERKNLSQMARDTLGVTYHKLHHFLTEAPWSAEQINERLKGKRKIAMVMNAKTFKEAKDIDYFITNVESSLVTAQWVVDTYSQRNWVEVFYREVKGWLGLKEYQVREERSLKRHFILVFCAYTFILWHKLTGRLRRCWANKPLKTFPEALSAFRTAISYRFVQWLQENSDLFTAYKASYGFIWS